LKVKAPVILEGFVYPLTFLIFLLSVHYSYLRRLLFLCIVLLRASSCWVRCHSTNTLRCKEKIKQHSLYHFTACRSNKFKKKNRNTRKLWIYNETKA